ncbi:MAG: hypothetical protein RLY57_389 [Candidatus Parcubacteria bacterium]|jgi:hypothetical protein
MITLGLNRIQLIGALILILAIIGYTIYAFSDYLDGPELVISFPYEGYSTTSTLIKVSGTAERAQFISLNDRPIYIDEKGLWNETLLLQPGYTIIKAFVRDRFGREQSSLIHVLRTEQVELENINE